MDKEQITLKPCPFCGGKAKVLEGTTSNIFGHLFYDYCVKCTDCSAFLGLYQVGDSAEFGLLYDTEKEAIEAWNTRAAQEGTPEEEAPGHE